MSRTIVAATFRRMYEKKKNVFGGFDVENRVGELKEEKR